MTSIKPAASPRVTANSEIILTVRVQPRSSSNAVVGMQDGMLKVRLTAPPVEGAANVALVAFLADVLGVKRRQITLVTGETSRIKVVSVAGVSHKEASSKLKLAMGT